MSKHKKHHKSNKIKQQDKKHLDFEKAKTMTVGEAVRQDNQLKAGITETDSVLDRYIKQHREEIGAKKFDTQSVPLDTQSLDKFIQKQRDVVEEEGLLDDLGETKVLEPLITSGASDPMKQLEQEQMDSILLEQSTPVPSHSSKKRRWLLLGLTALTAGVFASGYWLSNRAPKTHTNQTIVKSDKDKKDSLPKASDESKKAFEELYASFFVDEAKTQLKNEQLDKLSELEASLKALEGTSDYDSAKASFERLSKQIAALNKINAQFTNPVIVDGSKVESQINDTANFDQIGSAVLNTGNPSLDNLIQSAISDGRQQQAKKAEETLAAQQAQAQEAAQAAANQAAATAPAIPSVDTNAGQVSGAVSSESRPAYNATSNYGISNYDPAILQRHLSRVPYNHDVIADVNNPAWLFGDGVLERILDTSRKRGYIVGNDYILERVNIINGNGYYNMFKPDGTYLFSINAKTGYFVGNGKGYAEALDF